MPVTFVGFYSPRTGRTEKKYNQDIVEQGLRNHFNTKKGERTMNAEYGYIAWDLVFELQSPGVAQALKDDALRIIAQEPRVELIDIDVSIEQYGYTVSVYLRYKELETLGELTFVFDTRSMERR